MYITIRRGSFSVRGWTKVLFPSLLIVIGLGTSGCENKDVDDLARAQDCLNKVPNDDHGQAANCRQFVSGKSSQQAMILRCSIEFMAGGLTTPKILNAFEAQDGAEAKKEATLMTVLALDDLAIARAAVSYCNQSGVSGLMYLANLSMIGTSLKNSGIPLSETPTEAEIEAAIEACKTGDSACQPEDIGQAAIVLSESYCQGKDDDKICQDINQAVADGASADEIGEALLELLK